MIAVIGNGLFGSVLTQELLNLGHEVVLISDDRELSGSHCAACLTKPSWIPNGLGWVLGELRQRYAVRDERFDVLGGNAHITLQHVPVKEILIRPDIIASVKHLHSLKPRGAKIVFSDGDTLVASNVVVCTGAWANELFPEWNFKITAKQGVVLYFDDLSCQGILAQAQFWGWAPYKHAVSLPLPDGRIWFGNGTAIKVANWTDDYVYRAIAHAKRLGLNHPVEIRKGLRPYVPCKHGLCEEVRPGVWVNSGGGKNGLALAMVNAIKIAEALK